MVDYLQANGLAVTRGETTLRSRTRRGRRTRCPRNSRRQCRRRCGWSRCRCCRRTGLVAQPDGPLRGLPLRVEVDGETVEVGPSLEARQMPYP